MVVQTVLSDKRVTPGEVSSECIKLHATVQCAMFTLQERGGDEDAAAAAESTLDLAAGYLRAINDEIDELDRLHRYCVDLGKSTFERVKGMMDGAATLPEEPDPDGDETFVSRLRVEAYVKAAVQRAMDAGYCPEQACRDYLPTVCRREGLPVTPVSREAEDAFLQRVGIEPTNKVGSVTGQSEPSPGGSFGCGKSTSPRRRRQA